MKKNPFVLLLALVFCAQIFTSCSEDSEVVNAPESGSTDAFLKSFYSENYRLGKSVDIKAPSTVNKSGVGTYFVVTEVFVGDETRARGYNVTDKQTNKLIYFADVDRTNYVLKIIDLTTSETEIVEYINELSDYSLTNEFDFINIIENPVYTPPTNQVMGHTDCIPNGQHEYLYSGGELVGESCGWTCRKTFLGIKLGKKNTIDIMAGCP